MIKLLLLTGFLGSGKTTLMTNILGSFSGEKTGMIINEFGAAGVDGALLARDGVKMEELNNGSIFCACIKANFLQSLIEMSKQDISYLFIEPSGIADPSEMGQILETAAPKLEKAYEYLGLVCVVDAETFPKLSAVLPALKRQVEYCGAAVINKADLVGESRLEEVTRMVSEINPRCEIIVTSHCRLDARALAERISPADKAALDSTNTPEARPYSVVLKPHENGGVPVDALREFIEKLLPHVYRIKGFLPGESAGGVIEVSAVGSVINIEPWTGGDAAYGLVVISAVGIKIISRITDALNDAVGLRL